MTKRRDFKDLVRQRMARTGETYSTARSRVAANGAPQVSDFEETDMVWDADAKAAVRAALREAVWDYEEKVVQVPTVDQRGDSSSMEVKSFDELYAYAYETAFQGYNQTAPRDDGEWVFEFDEDIVDDALAEQEEHLVKIGWW